MKDKFDRLGLAFKSTVLYGISAVMLAVLGLTISSAGVVAAQTSSKPTGIYGTTYMTTCDASNVCTTSPASLIIYVYNSQSTNRLLSFTSSSKGSFRQSLAPGAYTLKGSPNCGLATCIQPSGNVSITVSGGYLNLKLVYDQSTGLTGGPQ